MSRINTNVSSLIAQTALSQSQQQLNTALTRLSTGLQINTGADNPSGLIAAATLQSDITATNQAITNSQQADQIISTADSGLSQIQSLLTNIQSLVSDAANTGATSSAQVAADQLQVDSSLQAIDQIAGSTAFGSQKLLDGSLNFITSAPSATLGATGAIGSAATPAAATVTTAAGSTATATVQSTHNVSGSVSVSATAEGTPGNSIKVVFSYKTGASGVSASVSGSTVTITGSGSLSQSAISGALSAASVTNITVTASSIKLTSAGSSASATTAGGAYSTAKFTATANGTAANGVDIVFSYKAGANASADYSASTKTLTITGGTAATAAEITSAVAASGAGVTVTATTGTTFFANSTSLGSATTTGGAFSSAISLTAASGDLSGTNVVVVQTATLASAATVQYSSSTSTLTVTEKTATTATQVAAAINTDGTFKATVVGGSGHVAAGTTTAATSGGATYSSAVSNLVINQANFGTASSIAINVDVTKQATQAQLVYSGGTLASNTVLQVGGDKGYQVLSLGSGTTVSQVATAINQISDSTGVAASVSGGNLTLSSTDYGSAAFVSINPISGSFATKAASGNTFVAATRSTGTDIVASINGEQATGNGLTASLNSSNLNLSFSLSSAVASGSSVGFNITGGGANFQLGPSVVSTEQARLGIPSVSTASLGGNAGFLYELASGGSLSLANNPGGAANVIADAITQVTTLRGRLGAFQADTLQTNINTLSNTVNNLTAAQSAIQDTNFASETAALTRAQILVQSGTSVLQIANQTPQQVLALLQHA